MRDSSRAARTPILLAIDAEVGEYHNIPADSKQARYIAPLGILTLCQSWMKSKVDKRSRRRTAVMQLREDSFVAAQFLEQELKEAAEKGGKHWAMLRRVFVPQGGKPGGGFTAAKALDYSSTEPAYGTALTGTPESVVEELQLLDKAKSVSNAFLLEAANPDHVYSNDAGRAYQNWIEARRKHLLALSAYLKGGKQGAEPKAPEAFFDWWKNTGGGLRDAYIDLTDTDSQEHKPVAYLSAQERLDYQIHISGGRMFWGPGGVDGEVDTTEWTTAVLGGQQGFGIFVLSTEPRMYGGEQVQGQFHHSSFLSGAPVLAAGEIKVRHGGLLAVTNNSGHYKPDALRHYNVLLYLQYSGINLARVQSSIQGKGTAAADVHLRELSKLNVTDQAVTRWQAAAAGKR
jgi:hypothetical protein